MALTDSIFPDGWEAAHKPVVKSAMKARIKVERVLGAATWNAETGLYEGGTSKLLYLGKARVQKVAKPTRREFVFDSADNQMMRVQLALDENEAVPAPGAFEWQSNDQVTILLIDANAMMAGQKLYIKGWAGSSNDWLQTLHCNFNSKQDG